MLLTSWLRSLRSGRLRNRLAPRRKPKAHRASAHGRRRNLFGAAVERLEDRTLLAAPTLISIAPNVGDFLDLSGENLRNEAPRELTFRFSPGQTIDADSLATGIQITRSGFDGDFANDNEVITPGFIGVDPNRREHVIIRFAESLPDDHYRIDILGSGSGALQNDSGEAFNNGNDQRVEFELDLGAQVTAVVPQPVLRDKILEVVDISRLADADTFTISVGGTAVVFEFDADDDLLDSDNERIEFDSDIDSETDLAGRIADAITGATFANAELTATASGAQVTLRGEAFSPRVGFSLDDDDDPPLSVEEGGLVQRDDIVVVHFNEDDLDPAAAQNPAFYQLFDTNGSRDRDDDRLFLPETVTYNADGNTAVLRFAGPLPSPATFRLQIGESQESDDVLEDALNVGTLFSSTNFSTVAFLGEGRDPAGNPLGVNDVDLYQFAVTVNDTVNVALTPHGTFAGTLRLFDASGNPIAVEANIAGGRRVLNAAVSAGTYFVGVSSNGNNSYDPQDRGTFENGTSTGSYLLEIDVSSILPTSDNNSSFDTANGLGTLGLAGQSFSASISPQSFASSFPAFPGGEDEPGIRQTPIESIFTSNAFPDQSSGLRTISYDFQESLGFDPQGNLVFNNITENQKQRAREIFELYGEYLGVQFHEASSSGFGSGQITVATGDMRVLDREITVGPGAPFSFVRTGFNSGTVILDGGDDWGESEYGGFWFRTALDGIGTVLGLANDTHLPNNAEPIFPDDVDVFNGSRLQRPDGSDLDLYQFEVGETGLFTAEIWAERDGSLLDAVLTLYNADREIIARNDDYFSNDSFLELNLEPGTYFIGVTSTGNTDFNPAIENSGFGGTTQGSYELNLDFTSQSASALTDADNASEDAVSALSRSTPIDGDADGRAGGAYDFWFRTADTVFVDKIAGNGGNGSIGNPYNTISDAVDVAGPGEIIRIVGNGGADADTGTADDAEPYLIGRDLDDSRLADGVRLNVPQGVTVMIDAGAVFKLQGANIDVGTSAQGIDRSQGALQVLGTPDDQVYFTSFADDAIGGDSNGLRGDAAPGDWGGLVFRRDSDFEENGIFLNRVNQAEIRFGGGQVVVDSVRRVFNPVHLSQARPTISFNTIVQSADAAISADPNSFEETRGEIERIGPDIHGNRLVNNSVNGLFVRVITPPGRPAHRLEVPGRFDDTDITHVISENLQIVGNPGGPLLGSPRLAGRLAVDPGIIVKMQGARIEAERGAAQLIAEGTEANPIIFTSVQDDRFGAGGTFDTLNDAGATQLQPGQWGGLIFNAVSSGSFDHVRISGAGGNIPIAGGFASFNTIEIHQADVRIANSVFERNAAGFDGSNRNGRGNNSSATVFVRGAQPVIVDNVFQNNAGHVVSVNANSLQDAIRRDSGRRTGTFDAFAQFDANRGPLVRDNRLEGNGINGMEIRARGGGRLTGRTAWDDVDIVHVLRDEIVAGNYPFGALRLQSAPDASLVVKLSGSTAGFTADGDPLDIDDRIGGTVHIVGAPGFPVVLTSLADDSIGAGFRPDGFPQNDTNGNGDSSGQPGDWRSIRFDRFANDRNARIVFEQEPARISGNDRNAEPDDAQPLGELPPNEQSADDQRPLAFNVNGFISPDDPTDLDVYSFQAPAGTEVFIDIDRTGIELDTVVELVRADGELLARATNNTVALGFLGTVANGLIADSNLGRDFNTINPRDAGMRVVLPGDVGTTQTYFVRVRSNTASGDLGNLDGGLTSGAYELQVRLRQVDNVPGSTVRSADIRFATDGVEVLGLPAHSPLVAESTEIAGEGNNAFGSAQELGNLLASDRNTFSVGGRLASAADVDWYQFTLDYDQISSPGGFATFAATFDIDYADGLARPDTTIAVFDDTGRLILVSRESNIEDDQPSPGQNEDLDDLGRGSVGKLDPFIGSVQMPAGQTSGSSRTYFVAVSSNRELPQVLNATFQSGATAALARLEPIDSVQRVIEDHIGFTGFTSGDPDEGTRHVGPQQGPLFNFATQDQLDAHVTSFTLKDVVLFTAGDNNLTTVNPFTGGEVITPRISFLSNSSANTTEDIVIRSDGRMFGYQRIPGETTGTVGRLVEIDPGTGAVMVVGNDGIPGSIPTPAVAGNLSFGDITFSEEVDALTFERTGFSGGDPDYNLFYSVRQTGRNGFTSKLFKANPNTGSAAPTGSPDNFGFQGYIQPGVTFAAANLVMAEGNNTATIEFRAVAPGPGGNGVTINIQRADLPNQVTVSGNTITLRLDTNPHPNAQAIVDLVNGNASARDLVTAAILAGGNAATGANNVADGTTISTSGGTGAPLLGAVTGLAFANTGGGPGFMGRQLFGVTDAGEFLEIDKTTGRVTNVVNTGLSFQGLALGPQNLQGGAFQNTLFATTGGGQLVAFDTAGNQQAVFDNGTTPSSTGPNSTGIAFSPLDFNLWHPTMRRRGDAGHGVNASFDNARLPGANDLSINGRGSNQGEGGASFSFGLDQWQNDPRNSYFTYGQNSQFGIQDFDFHRDLTSNPNIGDNFNLPGGGHGSMETNTFSLAGLTARDKPTLYFNYFLDTEGRNTGTDNMRDSARVFISNDGGFNWQMLATNNSVLDEELPEFLSHSRTADRFDSRQRTQELFDNTGAWRQARVDLHDFAGQSGLMLRFDFSTAGSTNGENLPGDNPYGNLRSAGRGQNNDHEGFFIDDIIIGASERGEMVTAAPTNSTGFFSVPQDPDSNAPSQILTGDYQLEIRRGTEFVVHTFPDLRPRIGNPLTFGKAATAIFRTFDTNARLVPEASGISAGNAADGRERGDVLLGDRNLERDPGHIVIEANQITDVANVGILVDAGQRDGNRAHPGSPIKTPTINGQRLAPGVVLENNVIAGFGNTGIRFSGDPNSGNVPDAVVPFGRIVNNTVYGGETPGGTGIAVTQNASPTLMNNIIANTATGISIDGTSSSTVVGTTLFQGNNSNGVTGSSAILLDPDDPLFVNPLLNNFYLAAGALAIDSSLNTLPDRPALVAVKNPLGIPEAPLFAPDLDRFGQLRVDDPRQDPPPGLGSNIFKDRGAIERADFVGGSARLIVPEDNGPLDVDPTGSIVTIHDPDLLLTEFVIDLVDAGIGIDDATVSSAQLQLQRNGAALVEGQDYEFRYNANTNQVFLVSLTTFPLDSRYTITVDRSEATGIKDLAGNRLQPNQTDGTIRFDVLVTNGVNDPPVNRIGGSSDFAANPQVLDEDEDTGLVFSAANGNAITVEDPDALLGDNRLQVTLAATRGVVALGGLSGITIVAGADGTETVTFEGEIPDLNTALEGFTFTPEENYNGPASVTITTDDLGNFGPDPLTRLEDSDTVTITVDAVNDAPVNLLNGDRDFTANPQTTDEEVDLVFSAANGNAITISDIDAADGTNEVEVTLTAANGVLTLAGTNGLTFSAGDGTGDDAMTFRGTIPDVNAALEGLIFTPNADFNGNAPLTITTNDQGNTGSDPGLTGDATSEEDIDTVTIAVVAVNDAPVNSVPAEQTTDEDVLLTFSTADGNAISVSDVDLDETPGGELVTVIEVISGTLAVAGGSGATVDDDGTASVTITGTADQVNAALDGLTYTPNQDFNGTETLTITTNDQGNTGNDPGLTGDATSEEDIDTVTIVVEAVNDPPVNSVPGEQTTDEDVPLAFSAAAGNAISVSDVDLDETLGGELVTVVSVANGTLTVTLGGGAVIGDDGTATVTITGTADQVNAALDGLSYTPDQDFNGTDTLTITTNDQGNTGRDPGLTGDDTSEEDIDTVSLNVVAVNDAPVNSVPDEQTTDEDVALTFSAAAGNAISVSDVDLDETPGGELVTVVSAANGILTVTLGGGATIDDDGTATVTITGTADQVNAALDGLTYTPDQDFNGTETLTITTNDQGNTGEDPGLTGDGSSEEDIDQVTIVVTEVNDAPIAAPDAATVAEDNSVTINVLANDRPGPPTATDEDGQVLTVIEIVDVEHGEATINPDGTILYTPDPDYFGPDTITYTITDNGTTDGKLDPKTAVGTVAVTVTEVNDEPIAGDDTETVAEDTTVTINVLANDSPGPPNESGQTLTVIGAVATNGIVDINPNGTLLYTPDQDFNGPDTITYTIRDNGTTNGAADPLQTTGTVSVTVTEVNDEPIAGNDSATVAEDSSVTFDVLSNDEPGPATATDEAGQSLTVVDASAENGDVTINPDGTLTYVPDPDYVGPDTITYTIEDDGTTNGAADPRQATGTVAVTVTPVNDAPQFTIAGDPQAVNEDSGPQTVANFATGIRPGPPTAVDEVGQSLLFDVTVVSTTDGLVFSSNPTIDPLTGELTYAAAADTFGTATVEVVLRDNGEIGDGTGDPPHDNESDPQTFTITVVPAFILGGRVWNDQDGDGIQDAGETGRANVRVDLVDFGPDGPNGGFGGDDDAVIASTTTAADGSFRFKFFEPGEYYLMLHKPPGLVLSPHLQGSDPTRDSNFQNFEPTTGRTGLVDLDVVGERDLTLDAGLVGEPTVSPPGTPVLNAPSGTTTDQTPTFAWTAASGAETYTLVVTNSSTGATVIDEDGLTATQFTPTQNLSAGSYEAIVTAVNSAGETASAPLDFTIETIVTQPPGRPTVTGPSGSTSNNRPTITWSAASGAASYQLLVYNTRLGREVINQPGLTATQFTVGTALQDDQYQVFVRAFNSAGSGQFSQSHLFTVQTSQTVPGPSQLTGPSSSPGTARPTFTWTNSSGATEYHLLVYNRRLGQEVINVTVPGATEFTPVNSLQSDEYEAFIRAGNSAGFSSFTGPRVFTIGAASSVPGPTAFTAPGSTTSGVTTFAWNAAAGASTYQLIVYDVAAGREVINARGISGTQFTNSDQPLSPGRQYAAYVRAENSAGFGPFAGPRTFNVGSTSTTAPGPTTLTSPGSTAGSSPTFAWTAADRATNYQLIVYDTAAGREVINVTVSGTQHTHSGTPLTAGRQHSAYIRAQNSAGAGPFAGPFNFSVVSATRDGQGESGPADGAERAVPAAPSDLPPEFAGEGGDVHLVQAFDGPFGELSAEGRSQRSEVSHAEPAGDAPREVADNGRLTTHHSPLTTHHSPLADYDELDTVLAEWPELEWWDDQSPAESGETALDSGDRSAEPLLVAGTLAAVGVQKVIEQKSRAGQRRSRRGTARP